MDILEQIKNTVTANGMREYADQQNAELRERVKELESSIEESIEIFKSQFYSWSIR